MWSSCHESEAPLVLGAVYAASPPPSSITAREAPRLRSAGLPSYYFPTTSLLLPYYFPNTSLLLPYYLPTTSLLLSYYFPTTSLLLPYYLPTTSLLLPYYFPTTCLLLPYYFPTTCLLLAYYLPTTSLLGYWSLAFGAIRMTYLLTLFTMRPSCLAFLLMRLGWSAAMLPVRSTQHLSN